MGFVVPCKCFEGKCTRQSQLNVSFGLESTNDSDLNNPIQFYPKPAKMWQLFLFTLILQADFGVIRFIISFKEMISVETLVSKNLLRKIYSSKIFCEQSPVWQCQ